MSDESFLSQVKRLIVGAPIPSHLAHHERFSKVTGLAVLSSDPLSSVAYATEEILRVLTIGGVSALWLVTPIGAVIATMLAVVAFSYRQTIHAYPNGGGAYIVAKENLGTMPALIAAAALLIDYVLTVSVSIAAGVAAITSALPQYHINPVVMSLVFVLILMFGNLRGIRESGRLFAAPTYFFIASILTMLGGRRVALCDRHARAGDDRRRRLPTGTGMLTTFMLLTAFSNGCTAMTGVEAVSNGVPAFRPPESRNAAATLVTMAVLAITMFIGITLLAHAYGIIPNDTETVVSQIARATFGGRGWPYYAVQAGTMLILVLAANTAYADFPRLASIVARDRFLPRQFMNQGDRLAFSNGIVILSGLGALLLVVFGGDTHALIPLYMIGVFVSFTLSQAGMVVHWRRLRDAGLAHERGDQRVRRARDRRRAAGGGDHESGRRRLDHHPDDPDTRDHFQHHPHATTTTSPSELTLRGWQPEPAAATSCSCRSAACSAPSSRRSATRARCQTTSARCTSNWIRPRPRRCGISGASGARASSWWCSNRPYRSLMEPLLEYIEQVQRSDPHGYVTVILPEFVPRRLWQHLLHNQHALLIKGALLFKPNVVVTSVPFHLGRGPSRRLSKKTRACGAGRPV